MKRFITHPLKLMVRNLGLWRQVMLDRTALELARNRCLAAGALFLVLFLVIGVRLTDVMLIRSNSEYHVVDSNKKTQMAASRADILDRNGEILATHLVTASVYANPKVILNPEEAALKLSKLLPEVGYDTLLKRLKSDKGFIWVTRHISPKIQDAVNHLGIPGIYLQRDERRVYPHGRLVSHVLGYSGVDREGLAGVEKYFDAQLKQGQAPLKLSIDVRVQHIVYDEMTKAIEEFQAEGGNAMVMDLESGELLSMVSFPDYDPNLPNQNAVEATFNRNTLGIYECGSTFKIFNTAIALETGMATLSSRYDATVPIRVGHNKISDFKPKNRVLDVKEVFIYSSNIGSAKMALHFGVEAQKTYLERFGMFRPPPIQLPEVGLPLVPKTWREVTAMTVAYGYGIAVSPLQAMAGVASVVTGKTCHPTLLQQSVTDIPPRERVLSEKTSRLLRDLMRLVVSEGTAKQANVPGYEVIGKTGTAHRTQGGGYAEVAKRTSFVGAFPKDNPKYILILFVDNPKPTKNTYGYATAGWTAAPIAGRIISRMAPLLGVVPIADSGQGDYISDNILMVNHKVTSDESAD